MNVTYLLDTNTISYIASGKSATARERLQGLDRGDVACISSITEAEVRYGLARRPDARALHRAMDALLLKFRTLPWGSKEAVAYGNLRAKLEAKGTSLSELDMLIAAHAIAVGAVLVTTDKAFARIKDLCGTANWATDI